MSVEKARELLQELRQKAEDYGSVSVADFCGVLQALAELDDKCPECGGERWIKEKSESTTAKTKYGDTYRPCPKCGKDKE